MGVGRKSSVIMQSLGVKNSRVSSSLGIKSQNPHLDADNFVRNHSSNGIIHNTSNSNNQHHEPIKGVPVSSKQDRNNLEKPRKLRSENNYLNK